MENNEETTKKSGRKSLGSETYVVIETTFRTKRKHLVNKGKMFWVDYIRNCIKQKETEIENNCK